ncbi:hypothetical protein SeLEV6574_g00176 [Synchytrium endobioticum]|uniref:Intraflagellar transport protein 122 homolog n=1 Tax=Synchytrium endobioticum TaxID=286115 RepID=A0A507DIY8_9FUNG|nr:hypothetical protein SeLEV6574_g00176 [Synchytrium endobioticum]
MLLFLLWMSCCQVSMEWDSAKSSRCDTLTHSRHPIPHIAGTAPRGETPSRSHLHYLASSPPRHVGGHKNNHTRFEPDWPLQVHMRSSVSWIDPIGSSTGPVPIYDLAFKPPDGCQLLAAAGSEVLVYDAERGHLLTSLKAHKETVYTVQFSADGNRFASGSADNTVIIWSVATGAGVPYEAVGKYSHSDSVQCVAWSPTTAVLLSGTANEIGLWSAEQKGVTRIKVNSKVLVASWNCSGSHFALGHFNGMVSVRSRTGEEVTKIDRGPNPVWSLAYCPAQDILAVSDWSQRLAFFQTDGKPVSKERALAFDACGMSYFNNGDYFVMGGQNKKVTLWTGEGIKLGTVAERGSWVWCCRVKPNQNFVAVGCQDGSLSMHQISFNTIHGLYNDRYAYREHMTNVVIQHLLTQQRARIKCRDHVKKIAIYKDRLAVQLSDRIIVYELTHNEPTDLHYKIKEKLLKTLECNLLVVTSEHIILCQDMKLQMYNFVGDKVREWTLDAFVRYIRVVGGPRSREGLLVGLKSGQVSTIYIDNPFQIPVVNIGSSVRCLDISMNRSKVAVVDEQNTVFVYDIKTHDLLYQLPNGTSVAWNTDMEDMLCYNGDGIVNIKSGSFPPHQQQMQGFVVGFKGSRIFCLNAYTMTTVDIPQTATLEGYLTNRDFETAYSVACLGVTDADWRRLAFEAIESLALEVARKAFVRLRDLPYVDLLRSFERSKAEGKNQPDLFLAEIYAYSGRYHEAAKLFKRCGHSDKAIEMYTELNMWDFATQVAEETKANPTDILAKKAQMLEEQKDATAAAATYVDLGDYSKAIDLYVADVAYDKLIDIVRRVDRSETKTLSRCYDVFKTAAQYEYAAETLVKLKDIGHLLDLHIEREKWDEAFKIIQIHPEYASQVQVPYANWLAANNRYEEAQVFYRKAGRLDQAFQVLEGLAQSAIVSCRFDDAAYHYWTLASEQLDLLPAEVEAGHLDETEKSALAGFAKHLELAKVYYAYHHVRKFIHDPFTVHMPETLLSMARFVLYHGVRDKPLPPGVSKAHVLFAAARLGRVLGANQLARTCFDKLQHLRFPFQWTEAVEIGALTIRGRTASDAESLLPVCPACMAVGVLLDETGARCRSCLEPTVWSFYSFDALPLAQFEPEPGVSVAEAVELLSLDPRGGKAVVFGGDDDGPSWRDLVEMRRDGNETAPRKSRAGKTEKVVKSSETVTLSNSSGLNLHTDRHVEGLLLNGGHSVSDYEPPRLSRKELQAIPPMHSFVVDWGRKCIPARFYRLVVPEAPVAICKSCKHFFHEEEWIHHTKMAGACPFCRASIKKSSV